MDDYNPYYEDYVNGKFDDVQEVLNKQNLIYGADNWYKMLEEITPKSYLLKLSDADIETFASGEIPVDSYLEQFVKFLISQGYRFVKTTHKSAHAFKPINNYNDFTEQMQNANIIMSFRRYKCEYLLFRQWEEMNLECRIYVYNKKIRYIESYRDANAEFDPAMFEQINNFVSTEVVPRLILYDAFSVDVYYKGSGKWGVIEINSPLWLKCGTYLIDYKWKKHIIHEAEKPICRYKDRETDEIIEL